MCDFIVENGNVHDKGYDIKNIKIEQLGKSIPSVPYFNEMIIDVAQKAEKAIENKNVLNNEMSLNQTMIYFHKAINSPSFKSANYKYRYLFIDEFQDTDDMQIQIFSELQKVLKFNLFVVGDLKQSIYRFRGATLDAFDRLKLETGLDNWEPDYDLRINYRTDHRY